MTQLAFRFLSKTVGMGNKKNKWRLGNEVNFKFANKHSIEVAYCTIRHIHLGFRGQAANVYFSFIRKIGAI